MFRVGFQGWVVALTIFCSIVFADSARAQGSNAALAQELSNPIANLISVPFVTNYDDGYGTGDGYRVFTNIQPLIPLSLERLLDAAR